MLWIVKNSTLQIFKLKYLHFEAQETTQGRIFLSELAMCQWKGLPKNIAAANAVYLYIQLRWVERKVKLPVSFSPSREN